MSSIVFSDRLSIQERRDEWNLIWRQSDSGVDQSGGIEYVQQADLFVFWYNLQTWRIYFLFGARDRLLPLAYLTARIEGAFAAYLLISGIYVLLLEVF